LFKQYLGILTLAILIGVLMGLLVNCPKRPPNTYSVSISSLHITKTICNDCHQYYDFVPEYVGQIIYSGTWHLKFNKPIPEIETLGQVININTDKFRLQDNLEYAIFIDASHGHSMNLKYMQVWAMSPYRWSKIMENQQKWIKRTDVIKQEK